MALIKCSECGKEISDRAITCPNCGCPNVAKNHCIINGTDVDCSFIFDKSIDQEIKVLIMVENTNLDFDVINKIIVEWATKGVIPPIFNGKESTWEEDMRKLSHSQADNTPKCPTCGSSEIQKIGGLERAASVGFWGLFSNKINKTYKCKNCGHTW